LIGSAKSVANDVRPRSISKKSLNRYFDPTSEAEGS
jgi:hypothetical protein